MIHGSPRVDDHIGTDPATGLNDGTRHHLHPFTELDITGNNRRGMN